jgi:hypothetical protein
VKRPDENNWERGLRAALPPKKASEEFKMELKQRLLDNYPNRQRKQSGWKWMGLVAALLLVIGNLVWQSMTPVDLPLLPSLASADRETLGASAGPGFTVELSYQLQSGLKDLPDRVAAHRYNAVPFSAEDAEELAGRLGVDGQAVQEQWQDSHIFVVGEGEKTLVAFPDGFRNYFRHYPATEHPFGSEAELVAAAKQFLPQLGIDEESVTLLSVVPGSVDTPAAVMFVPAEFSNQVSVAPYARISVGADQEIYAAGWVWPMERIQSIDYPTRTVEQAWNDVLAGNARISLDYSQLQGPVSGNVLVGDAMISDVAVGYLLTYDQNGEMVMQPVAAFSGEASFADGSELPVTVYTALIADSYYSE